MPKTDRVLQLLALLQQEPGRPYTLIELEERLGVAAPTLRRYLGVLRAQGYSIQESTPRGGQVPKQVWIEAGRAARK